MDKGKLERVEQLIRHEGLLHLPSKDDWIYIAVDVGWVIFPLFALRCGVKMPLNDLFAQYLRQHDIAPS